jgi:hypothetical protein
VLMRVLGVWGAGRGLTRFLVDCLKGSSAGLAKNGLKAGSSLKLGMEIQKQEKRQRQRQERAAGRDDKFVGWRVVVRWGGRIWVCRYLRF